MAKASKKVMKNMTKVFRPKKDEKQKIKSFKRRTQSKA